MQIQTKPSRGAGIQGNWNGSGTGPVGPYESAYNAGTADTVYDHQNDLAYNPVGVYRVILLNTGIISATTCGTPTKTQDKLSTIMSTFTAMGMRFT